MAYIHRPAPDNAYALTDYKAALANYGNAVGRLQEQERFPVRNGDIATLEADVAHFKAILEDVRQYVTVAGGHPNLP
ncbi:hypothetical protein GQ85_06385 [Rhodococcus rhodochrous]|nr:hypothetical protein GQ85_06385 [Rhodococcus rhodochrous]